MCRVKCVRLPRSHQAQQLKGRAQTPHRLESNGKQAGCCCSWAKSARVCHGARASQAPSPICAVQSQSSAGKPPAPPPAATPPPPVLHARSLSATAASSSALSTAAASAAASSADSLLDPCANEGEEVVRVCQLNKVCVRAQALAQRQHGGA